jgi:guanylate kinase
MRLKTGMRGGSNKNLIFLTGYAASGKSTISSKYIEKGYHVISTDDVIRDELIPLFEGQIKGQRLFSVQLYKDKYKDDKVWVSAKKKFLEIMKEKVEEGINLRKKVLVEGQLRIPEDIRYIFGEDDNFSILVVSPESIESYADRLTSRVKNDPDNYGRLAHIRARDKDGSLLHDLLTNGKDGELWRPFIMEVSEELFPKHQRGIDHFQENFGEITIVLKN